MGILLTISKVFTIFFLPLWEQEKPWQYPGNFQNKSGSSSLKRMPRYVLLLTKLKGRVRPFLLECPCWWGRGVGVLVEGVTARDYPQEHLVVLRDKKVSPFVKFKIIPKDCYLLDPLTNKYIMTWDSMMNFVDRFQDLQKESCCHQGESLIITWSFKEKIIRER